MRSPIYCDNRVLLSYPAERNAVRDGLVHLVREHFPGCTAVSGVATAGIAHAALIADAMGLPMSYVRPEPKKHGLGNQIEGRIAGGESVVLVEDLISTGKSSLAAALALKESGANLLGVVAVFNYGFPSAAEKFREAGIPFYTLTGFGALLPAAAESGYINNDEAQALQSWSANPQAWSDRFTAN